MIALLFWHRALLICAPFIVLVIWWITRPAKCPRCCDRYDGAAAGHRPDRATCARCGTNYNPITGAKL